MRAAPSNAKPDWIFSHIPGAFLLNNNTKLFIVVFWLNNEKAAIAQSSILKQLNFLLICRERAINSPDKLFGRMKPSVKQSSDEN
jgi:hypothetical protein